MTDAVLKKELDNNHAFNSYLKQQMITRQVSLTHKYPFPNSLNYCYFHSQAY